MISPLFKSFPVFTIFAQLKLPAKRFKICYGLADQIDQDIQGEKKLLYRFWYSKIMANFETFQWDFSLSINPKIVRSVH